MIARCRTPAALLRRPMRRRRPAQRGLTLLELVAVLVILAVVATVAVQSLQPRVDQARFEQSRQLLENLRWAVAGQRNSAQADGTPLISGFVADVGRLPIATLMAGDQQRAERTLDELWSPNSRLAQEFPFRSRSGPPQPMDYSSIRIPCGWRGPYLLMGVGQRELADAWGRPLDWDVDTTGEVWRLRSQPLASFGDEPAMEADLTVARSTVSGVLQWGDQSPPSDAQVVLLVPDPRVSTEHLAVRPDEDIDPSAFLFTQVPIGLRAVCVQIGDRRIVRYVQVPQGGITISIPIGGTAP